MRVEQLSTYAADQISSSRHQVQAARSGHDLAQVDRLEAEAELAAARRSKPWWRRLFGLASQEEQAARQRLAAAADRQAELAAAGDDLAIQLARRNRGEEGEHVLERTLSRLTDDWIMFRSYQSKGGEADAVLVGPDGVWVVEVKNRRVRLTVDGDQWFVDRLSQRGLPQGREPARDGGGRPWGNQAADAGRALSRWLSRNDQEVTIRTAVVLVDPGASIVSCRDPGVDLVTTSIADLERHMRMGAARLSAASRLAIEDLIRRDHRHTERQRQKRQQSG